MTTQAECRSLGTPGRGSRRRIDDSTAARSAAKWCVPQNQIGVHMPSFDIVSEVDKQEVKTRLIK